MGRAATAAEVQKVMAQVAAIEAGSAAVDDTLAVSHRPPLHALITQPHLPSLHRARNRGQRARG